MNFRTRSKRLLAVIKPLRDVDGVLGAVVWDTGGNLLVHEMPELWGVEVLREVGVRVAYLCASFNGEPGQFAGTALVFAEHRLQLRVFGSIVIGVLMAADANASALQMALHIAGRQLNHDGIGRAPVAPPHVPPSPDPPLDPSEASAGEAVAGPGVRVYRGQRISE